MLSLGVQAVELKVVQIDEGLGVLLPETVLARLRAGPGDAIHLVETPAGFLLTPLEVEDIAQAEVARKIMVRRRGLLKALAGTPSAGD